MGILVVGLGKMGLNIAKNMKEHGFNVIGFDIAQEACLIAKESNIKTYANLEEAVNSLGELKIVWLMTPAGEITRSVLDKLFSLLKKDAIIIDAGNSNYKDTIKQAQIAQKLGIHFFDCGTSGGTSGARNGACLMIGGDEKIFTFIEPLVKAISAKNGYLYTGKAGSGHFLKMIHNGIEYAMMQAIGEGFELLQSGPFNYNYEEVAKLWNNGSVIRSFLIELCQSAFAKDANLDAIYGVVNTSGEAEWTVKTALEYKVPIPAISAALFSRYRSLQEDNFASKVIATLRNEFGGHEMKVK